MSELGNSVVDLGLRDKILSRFGFRFEKSSAHTARSMMFKELQSLLSCVSNTDASNADYRSAIILENCIGTRSEENRKISNSKLGYLYGLDSKLAVFRVLRYFWDRDENGRPLLALLCVYARDSILRMSAPVILSITEGQSFCREVLEEHIDRQEPNRFSEATLKSTVRNLSASWTKSGHLVETNVGKIRSKVVATVGSVAYALFLGYLVGVRGEALFESEYMRLLDCSFGRGVELAEEASRRGWITFKHIGKVMEFQFPNLLTAQEKEWIHDQ